MLGFVITQLQLTSIKQAVSTTMLSRSQPECQRGAMVGTTPLMRSLPDMLPDANRSRVMQDDVETGEGRPALDLRDGSEYKAPLSSGIMYSMFSSSLTTTSMDGRSSGLSWQQLRAKATNLPKHSDAKEPNLVSTIERIVPI